LCRAMHFVICRECVQYIRENRAVVECPFCRTDATQRAYQEEMTEMLLPPLAQQTLSCLEVRPEMQMEGFSRIARETRVALRKCSISYEFFLFLVSRTRVEIDGTVSLFGHRD
ncbi:MAG: uncharacterized protein A8A55_3454, partial [Amphiamblys sp. WSBS2006]